MIGKGKHYLHYLRLKREGNTLMGYFSQDGLSWGAITAFVRQDAQFGFGACSSKNQSTLKSPFRRN